MQRGIVVPSCGLLLVVWLGGCVADNEDGAILVLKNVRADATCTVTGLETELGVSHGSLDLLIPTGYLFIAQMKSRITALAGQEDQRTIFTDGANIDITFPNSSLFSEAELAELQSANLTHYRSPFSVNIKPNGGVTDGPFEMIPGALTARIAAKVGTAPTRVEAVATFTIVGKMSGGTVSSQPFSFPITIGAGVVMNVAGACPLPKEFGMPRTGYSCNPAQDGVVDCCDTGTSYKCPATIATM